MQLFLNTVILSISDVFLTVGHRTSNTAALELFLAQKIFCVFLKF